MSGDQMSILGFGNSNVQGSNVHLGVGDQISGDPMSSGLNIWGSNILGIKYMGIKCPQDQMSTFGSEIKCTWD